MNAFVNDLGHDGHEDVVVAVVVDPVAEREVDGVVLALARADVLRNKPISYISQSYQKSRSSAASSSSLGNGGLSWVSITCCLGCIYRGQQLPRRQST